MLASVTYTADGSGRQYDVPFGYISKTHVHVYVDLVEDTTFTWVNATRVQASSIPTAGAAVLVKRVTPTTQLTDFTNDSVLSEEDLDRALIQALYVAQETTDALASRLPASNDAVYWDAGSKELRNLAAPGTSNSAVRKADLDSAVVGVGQVPVPTNPGDNNKFLVASGGAWSWVTLTLAKLTNLGSYWLTRLASSPAADVQTVLDAADNSAIRTALAVAGTALPNTFTADQNIYLANNGSTVGPSLVLTRYSASPTNGDGLGCLDFRGQNLLPANITYALIFPEITDATTSSEDCRFKFQTMQAGSLTTRAMIGGGLVVGNATDEGSGTVNVASDYYRAGVILPFQKSYTSTAQTITSAGQLTLSHGLGAIPKLLTARIVCQSAEGNYSVGDEVYVQIYPDDNAGTTTGCTATLTSTQIIIRFSATAVFIIHNKSTGVRFPTTNANWQLYVSAFA